MLCQGMKRQRKEQLAGLMGGFGESLVGPAEQEPLKNTSQPAQSRGWVKHIAKEFLEKKQLADWLSNEWERGKITAVFIPTFIRSRSNVHTLLAFICIAVAAPVH